jgi:hypothetical protein
VADEKPPRKSFLDSLAIDPAHPFFASKLRRHLTVWPALAWGLFEFANNQPFWGVLFVAISAYAFWVLIWTFKEAPADPKATKD